MIELVIKSRCNIANQRLVEEIYIYRDAFAVESLSIHINCLLCT